MPKIPACDGKMKNSWPRRCRAGKNLYPSLSAGYPFHEKIENKNQNHLFKILLPEPGVGHEVSMH
jgi:hypothetical protein